MGAHSSLFPSFVCMLQRRKKRKKKAGKAEWNIGLYSSGVGVEAINYGSRSRSQCHELTKRAWMELPGSHRLVAAENETADTDLHQHLRFLPYTTLYHHDSIRHCLGPTGWNNPGIDPRLPWPFYPSTKNKNNRLTPRHVLQLRANIFLFKSQHAGIIQTCLSVSSTILTTSAYFSILFFDWLAPTNR